MTCFTHLWRLDIFPSLHTKTWFMSLFFFILGNNIGFFLNIRRWCYSVWVKTQWFPASVEGYLCLIHFIAQPSIPQAMAHAAVAAGGGGVLRQVSILCFRACDENVSFPVPFESGPCSTAATETWTQPSARLDVTQSLSLCSSHNFSPICKAKRRSYLALPRKSFLAKYFLFFINDFINLTLFKGL